jgi:medium-chain acyl-[acyl-carrier-protein] hydrolase
MTDLRKLSTPLCLPYSAVNALGFAKTDWLLDVFQDIASEHCHALGVSGLHMAPKGLKWVVAQYRLAIHAQITWQTHFNLSTWRYPWNNLYETRRFSLVNDHGDCLADATGIWILVKADSGRPVRLNRHLPQVLMDQAPEKDPKLIKTHPQLAPAHGTRFPVLFRDMDLNQHVNNAAYLRWALESIPHPHGLTYLVTGAQISYLKECFYPETVDCEVSTEMTENGCQSCHAIIRPETREILARIFLAWKKHVGANASGARG